MAFSLLLFYLSGIFIPIESWVNERIDELKVRGETPVEFVNNMPYEKEKVIENLKASLKVCTTTAKKLLIKRILQFYQNQDYSREFYGRAMGISDTICRSFQDIGIAAKLSKVDFFFELRSKIGKSDEYPIILCKEILAADLRRAYSTLKFDNFSFLLGREPIKWGPNPLPSLLLSGCAPPYDLLMISYESNRLKGTFFFTYLDPYFLINTKTINDIAITDTTTKSRFYSAHRLDLSLFQGNLLIGISEAVLFTRKNGFPEFYYINPISFYYLYQLNRRGFDENLVWDLDFSWYFSKSNLYGELLVDDFCIKDPSIEPPQIGCILGFKTVDILIPKSYWIFQYSRVNTWTYLHSRPENYHRYLGYPIGHPRGPDFDEIYLKVVYHLNFNWDFHLSLSSLRHGESSIEQDWIYSLGEFPPGSDFLWGTVQKSFDLKLGFTFFRLSRAVAYGQLGYSWINNYNHEEGEKKTFLSINLTFEIKK